MYAVRSYIGQTKYNTVKWTFGILRLLNNDIVKLQDFGS